MQLDVGRVGEVLVGEGGGGDGLREERSEQGKDRAKRIREELLVIRLGDMCEE